jgi:hypothetical protein
MSPDDVCERFANRGAGLSLSLRDDDMVMIEGDRASLEFLADLIRAQAGFEKDSGFAIQPHGAGSVFFGTDSKLGIYIHRVDLESEP